MKSTTLLRIAITTFCSTPAVLGTATGLARKQLQHSLPSSTTYVKATPINARGQPEATPGLPLLRFQARQNANSTTLVPAVIVSDGSIISSFPAYLCGFVDGDPGIWRPGALNGAADIFSDIPFTCSEYETCAGVSSSICCMTSGVCPVSTSFTACQNVQITDYDEAYYGSTSFTVYSRLYCDLYQGVQCHTNALGSLAETICYYTTFRVSQTIYPPQQFLTYFAGYTIEWNKWWTLLAVKSGPTTSTSATSAAPTDAVGYLDDFKIGAPSCVTNMTTLCPDLYASIQTCHNGTIDRICYCNAFTSHSCVGLCLADKEPNDYLNYITPTCQYLLEQSYNSSEHLFDGNNSANWTSSWPDYTNVSNMAYIQLFPWAWDVRLNATELANGTANRTTNNASEQLEQCPSVKLALLSFAVVNTVVFVASVVTANRIITNYLTCKRCAGPEGGKWWPLSAVLSVGINLTGNFVNAFLIKGTAGYHHVPLMPLVLLWCTRPRLAWLVVAMVWMTGRLGYDQTLYLDSAVSALMAEVILQATAAIYMGITVNHARVNQFYLVDHVKYTPHGSDALVMYSGALLWTVSAGIAIFYGIFAFTPVGGIAKEAIVATRKRVSRWSAAAWQYFMIGCVYAGVYLWSFTRGVSLAFFVLVLYWCIYYPIKHFMWKKSWSEEPKGMEVNPGQWFRITIPHRYNELSSKKTMNTTEDQAEASDDGGQSQQRTSANGDKKRKEKKMRPKRKKQPVKEYIQGMGLDPETLINKLNWLVLCLLLPWMGQWIFWIGFVRMAQDLYCPPKIWSLTGVWSLCSVLANMCGATL